jgi:phosphohistidine swiveling domain-containing protein
MPENLKEPFCEWDSTINPEANLYTMGNAEEVLPGVCRPFVANFIQRWDRIWHLQLAKDLDVEDLVRIPEVPEASILAIVAGRFTINVGFVTNFSATYSVGEGSDYLEAFFEGGEILHSEASTDEERAAKSYLRLIKMGETSTERAQAERREAAARYRESLFRNWQVASDGELLHAVDEATDLSGRVFTSHYHNSTAGGELLSALNKRLDAQVSDHPEDWGTRISSGLSDVESSRPAKAIWDLSRVIKGLPVLADIFASLATEEILANLNVPSSQDWEVLKRAFGEFIEELGYRGQRETDPSQKTWNENSSFVISSLKANLAAADDRNPYVLEKKQVSERESLESEIVSSFSEKEQSGFRRDLALVQELTSGREYTKATWAMSCRTCRPPMIELGTRLVDKNVIGDVEDIFFLLYDEVAPAIHGEISENDAKKKIKERKVVYENLKGYFPPVLFERPFELEPIIEQEAVAEATYEGQGISPGSASGPARVVRSVEEALEIDLKPGEILVAPFTDAPWTPLFIPAAGVVVETGGVLSHAATVAREYGIPAVSNVRGAASGLIVNGAIISLDGASGEVTVSPPDTPEL